MLRAQYFSFPHQALVSYDCHLPCNLCSIYSFRFMSFTPVVSIGLTVQTSLLNYPSPRTTHHPESLLVPAASDAFHQVFFRVRGHLPPQTLIITCLIIFFVGFMPSTHSSCQHRTNFSKQQTECCSTLLVSHPTEEMRDK